MGKIKRFIEANIDCPCNLRCSYCYLAQKNYAHKQPDFRYKAEHIGKSLSMRRMGGSCFFNITGAGETMIPKEIVSITYELLRQGHYVSITTNGTISERFDEILRLPPEFLRRLQVAFSLHYVELLKKGLINRFFDNVDKIKASEASFFVNLNLCDDYLQYIEEIKAICLGRLGALPQVTLTDDYGDPDKPRILSSLSHDEYVKLGKTFDSPIFDFNVKNFMVKRKEFCYAGEWTSVVDLCSGGMCKCFSYKQSYNVFANIDEPIPFEAVGTNCRLPYCNCGINFLAFGTIPSLKIMSYADFRDRPSADWYKPHMKGTLSCKLGESNRRYDPVKKFKLKAREYESLISDLKQCSLFKSPETRLTLTVAGKSFPDADGSEIGLIDVIVDSKTYRAKDMFGEGWIHEAGGGLKWNDYTSPRLIASVSGVIPAGRVRKLRFEKNRWRGKVLISFNGSEKELDCYANENSGVLVYYI